MPALHTPARSQCRRDALPPRPGRIRTSQLHKEVVSGRLSPRDAELLVVLSYVPQMNSSISVVGIA